MAACRLFAGIDGEELKVMLECLNPAIRSYKKDEYLSVQGDDLYGLGVLLAGEALVVKENAAGERVIMAVLGAGDIFGDGSPTRGRLPSPKELSHFSYAGEDHRKLKACPSHRRLITNTRLSRQGLGA